MLRRTGPTQLLTRLLAIGALASAVVFNTGCAQRMMGVNYAGEKLNKDRPWYGHVGYYFLNRLLDTIDMVTLNVGVGPALHAEAHITNAARLGVGGAYLASVGTGAAPREAGFFGRGVGELSIFPWHAQRLHWDEYLSTGTSFDSQKVGLVSPTELLYRRKSDFWSVGASVGVLLVGGQIEIHPLQIADWLAGWVTIDFLHDDL